jgi:hypothetical protein
MPRPLLNTVTSAVRNKESVSVKIQREGELNRWVCSCGATGKWQSLWGRHLIGGDKDGGHRGGWWAHVRRIHGSEYE